MKRITISNPLCDFSTYLSISFFYSNGITANPESFEKTNKISCRASDFRTANTLGIVQRDGARLKRKPTKTLDKLIILWLVLHRVLHGVSNKQENLELKMRDNKWGDRQRGDRIETVKRSDQSNEPWGGENERGRGTSFRYLGCMGRAVGAVSCRDKGGMRRSAKKNKLFWNIC